MELRTHVSRFTGSAAMLAVALVGAAAALRAQSAPAATSSHPSGLFLSVTGAESDQTKIHGQMMTGMKQKGLGKSILTQGISKPTMIVEVAGTTADARLKTATPTFFFYFDPSAGKPKSADPSNMDMTKMMSQVSDPDFPYQATSAEQFQLIHVTQTDDGREGNLGTAGNYRNSKDAVSVTVEKVAASEYKVQPKAPLPAGEYAFYFAGVKGSGGGGILWSFGVDAGK